VDRTFTWVAVALAALVLLAWYLSFSASRLDRLHHRGESSKAALDTQLVRRAAACLDAAAVLDPASALLLTDAAAEALAAGEEAALPGAVWSVRREEAESGLSRALQITLDEPVPGATGATGLSADTLLALAQACERVQLARRFHNDAVAQAQRVRRKRVVRWARLAGTAAYPVMFEIDDSLPAALVR
jgi:hypothetical protein